jgi:hypothetical protein
VIARSDTEACQSVVDESEDGSLWLQRGENGSRTANDRDEYDESNIEPVDMLIPILDSERLLGNVHKCRRHLLLF